MRQWKCSISITWINFANNKRKPWTKGYILHDFIYTKFKKYTKLKYSIWDPNLSGKTKKISKKVIAGKAECVGFYSMEWRCSD